MFQFLPTMLTRSHIPIVSQVHLFDGYNKFKLFVAGREAVDWMISRMGLETRDQGAKILQSMLSKNVSTMPPCSLNITSMKK